MTKAEVVFHFPEAFHHRYKSARHLALYPAIEAVMVQHGGRVRIAEHRAKAKHLDVDDNLHIVENGRIHSPGFLNATLAYLRGFWHLDPQGVLAESEIGSLRFKPESIDPVAAAAFQDDLRQRFAVARKSRYHQARDITAVPEGAIVVFLQGPSPQRRGHAHLPYADMVHAVVAGSGGRPVLVKPHPLHTEMGQQIIAAVQAQGVTITETAANVHDLLAGAALSVSVNSAAAIEGFLHGTPAVLFGRSDFQPMVETVYEWQDFPEALARALTTKRDYAAWLYWYFNGHCLNLAAPDFATQLFARFARAGFDADRLGLRLD